MPKTHFFRNEILKISTGQASSLSLPITPYGVLYTVLPNADGTGGVEVSAGGYSSQPLAGKFPTPSAAGTITNDEDIDWGEAIANWGQIVGGGIKAGATGNLLRFGSISPPITINAGSPASVPAGSWTMSET